MGAACEHAAPDHSRRLGSSGDYPLCREIEPDSSPGVSQRQRRFLVKRAGLWQATGTDKCRLY